MWDATLDPLLTDVDKEICLVDTTNSSLQGRPIRLCLTSPSSSSSLVLSEPCSCLKRKKLIKKKVVNVKLTLYFKTAKHNSKKSIHNHQQNMQQQ